MQASWRSSGIHEVSSRYGANSIIGSEWDWCNLAYTAGVILNGGKAYTIPIRYHGIDIESMKADRWSGYGEMNWWHFLLANVADRSIHGQPHRLNTGINNSRSIDHSMVSVSPGSDKLSACTLQCPGMWTGINIIRFRSQNFSILILPLSIWLTWMT